jgi:hypothetical protein
LQRFPKTSPDDNSHQDPNRIQFVGIADQHIKQKKVNNGEEGRLQNRPSIPDHRVSVSSTNFSGNQISDEESILNCELNRVYWGEQQWWLLANSLEPFQLFSPLHICATPFWLKNWLFYLAPSAQTDSSSTARVCLACIGGVW